MNNIVIKYVDSKIVCTALNLLIRNKISDRDAIAQIVLASQVRINTKASTIDIQHLAKLLGLHADTVRRSLKNLSTVGVISIEDRPGKSNVYTFNEQSYIDFEISPCVKVARTSDENSSRPTSNNSLDLNCNSQALYKEKNNITKKIASEIVDHYLTVKARSQDNSFQKAVINVSTLLEDFSKSQLIASINNYLESCTEKRCDQLYRLNCNNFFSPQKRHFEKYLDKPTSELSGYSDDQLAFINNKCSEDNNG